jgi:hypothetical protein
MVKQKPKRIKGPKYRCGWNHPIRIKKQPGFKTKGFESGLFKNLNWMSPPITLQQAGICWHE